jgi:hypothetical protein
VAPRTLEALLVACFTTAACSHAVIEINTPAINISEAPKDTLHEYWASGFLFGLVPPRTFKSEDFCAETLVRRVETRRSFMNGLVSFLTIGIYTPETVTIACARPERVVNSASSSGSSSGESTVKTDSERQASAGSAAPHEVEQDFTGATLYLDQDSFLKHTTDQFYTMGGMFARSGHWVVQEHLDRPLRFFDRLFHVRELRNILGRTDSLDPYYESHAIQGGVSAFTLQKGFHFDNDGKQVFGDSLGDTLAHPKDRPYACLAYLETRETSARGKNAFSSTLSAGVLGTGICRVIQTTIHQNLTHDTTPGGWKHQISNGGEPTLKYEMAYTRLLVAAGPPRENKRTYDADGTHWLEWTMDSELDAGYYTYAAAGSRVRLGFIHSPFWDAARRPVGPVIRDRSLDKRAGEMGASAKSASSRFLHIEELYGWISGGATEWAYNGLLQGQFRHSDVRLSFNPADTEVATLHRTMWDVEWGINARVGRLGLMYQHNHHSPAFGGPESRPHAWGGIYISFAPPRSS